MWINYNFPYPLFYQCLDVYFYQNDNSALISIKLLRPVHNSYYFSTNNWLQKYLIDYKYSLRIKFTIFPFHSLLSDTFDFFRNF